MLVGGQDSASPVADAELAVDGSNVALQRVDGDRQVRGDLVHRAQRRQQLQNSELATAQHRPQRATAARSTANARPPKVSAASRLP